MKKIPAIVLFTILLVNTAGFYVYYVIALHRIHLEMRAKLKMLPDEALTRLVLSLETYQQALVEDDEINLQGRMYDIARVEIRGDAVIAFALHDEKEENFLAFANEIISKPFVQDSGVTGSVLYFISLVFLPGQHVKTSSCDCTPIAHHSNYLFLLHTLPLSLEAPPPRTLATFT